MAQPPSGLMAIGTFFSLQKSLMARPSKTHPPPLDGLAISGDTFFATSLTISGYFELH